MLKIKPKIKIGSKSEPKIPVEEKQEVKPVNLAKTLEDAKEKKEILKAIGKRPMTTKEVEKWFEEKRAEGKIPLRKNGNFYFAYAPWEPGSLRDSVYCEDISSLVFKPLLVKE